MRSLSELVHDYKAGMLLCFAVASYSSAQLRLFLALIAANFSPLIDRGYPARRAGLACLHSLSSKMNNCGLIPGAALMAMRDPLLSFEG